VTPNLQVLLQTNTNAGDKLRQVAFDTAVIRHLGSTLYAERVRQYQSMKGINEDSYDFSEKDLVAFFKGEHREILRYIIDASRVGIITNKDNHLIEFVEWSGKSADQPLSYTNIERRNYQAPGAKGTSRNYASLGILSYCCSRNRKPRGRKPF
jgi:hypothetical protein